MYEVDSLRGPECGGEMKIVSFIEKRPPNVVEKILLHCRLPKGPDLQVYLRPLCKPAFEQGHRRQHACRSRW